MRCSYVRRLGPFATRYLNRLEAWRGAGHRWVGLAFAIASGLTASASAVTLYPIDLANPQDPATLPLGAVTVSSLGSTAYAFSGGNTWTFGAVALTARTTVWHAVKPDGVKGGVCGAGTANYPFSPASSDLPNGKLVFASGTDAITMHYFQLDGVTPIALTAPATLSSDATLAKVGGLAPVPATGFKLNFALTRNGIPAATVCANPNGTGPFAIDFSAGFYWDNVAPRLATNSTMAVTQNATHDATVTVTNTSLRATDVEGDAAGDATQIQFKVNGTPHNGVLKKSGVALAVNDTFTQDDINNNRITYTNNGTCDSSDDFQFGVRDAVGGIAADGSFTSFSARFSMTLLNLPPIANNGSLSVGLGATRGGNLTASNSDCVTPSYTYAIQSLPTKGTVTLLNSGTGAYSYVAATGQSGADSFTFSVNDGLIGSIGNGTIAVTIANQAPTAQNQDISTSEGAPVTGTLVASDVDLPPQALTYSLLSTGSFGTATITDASTGAFQYTPQPGRMGFDSFTFKANDGALDSPVATVNVNVRPNTTVPGRILVTAAASSSGPNQGKPQAIIAIDPTTGDKGLVAMGGNITDAHDLLIEPTGAIIVVENGGTGKLLRIDPATGAQTVLATGLSPNPGFQFSNGVARESSGTLLVAAAGSGVRRIDPVTGASLNTFSGGSLLLPLSVAVGPSGDIFVGDAGAAAGGSNVNAVVRINPSTGAQTVITSSGSLSFPVGLAVAPSGDIYVSNAPGLFFSGPSTVVRVDPATGTQTTIATNGSLANPASVVVTSDGDLMTANAGAGGSVVRVNPVSTTQTVIAAGNPLNGAWGVAVIPPVTVAPATVPGGTWNTAYATQNFSATGGSGAYTWSISSGALPAGLTLTPGGVLSGTPTSAGTFTFDIRATDSSPAAIGGPFSGSTSFTITISKASSATTLAANLAPSAPGQTVVLTATVTPSGPSLSGSVEFLDGATAICSGVALVGNQAQCVVDTLTVGVHSLAATFSGNANYLTSTSPPLSHTVNASANATLNVVLAGTGSGSVLGSPPGINCGSDCSETYAGPTVVTLTALPTGGAVFTGWSGACIGRGSCSITMSSNAAVTATFAPSGTALNLDVDGNLAYLPDSDALLILRYLFGFRGLALTRDALGTSPAVTDPALIAQRLDNLRPVLDVDGDGQATALTDGLLILRYFLRLSGVALTQGAVAPGASRTQSVDLQQYLDTLTPALP